jgi:hypothetical protein
MLYFSPHLTTARVAPIGGARGNAIYAPDSGGFWAAADTARSRAAAAAAAAAAHLGDRGFDKKYLFAMAAKLLCVICSQCLTRLSRGRRGTA